MNTVNAANKSEIDMMTTLLSKKYAAIYADVWKVGVNVSLRISDLLKIKFSDCQLEERLLTLVEAKTGKSKVIRLNTTAIAVIKQRRLQHPGDTWLFEAHSNRSSGKPITRVSVSRIFKEAGDVLGLTINTHSMRKSRGKAMYDDGVPIEKIAKVLNHSNTTSTLRYLGITREEVLKTYDDYEL